MSRDAQHTTSDVVAMFARQGIATETISRALAIPVARVEEMCVRARESGDIQMMPPRTPADGKGALVAEVTNLRAQLDDALARARDVDDLNDFERFYQVAGMTRSEATIVGTLARSGRATKSTLFYAMYGEEEWPGEKILDVFICKTRKKLKPYGIGIETIWGVGYAMGREDVAKLRALAAEEGRMPSPRLVPTHAEMVA